MHLSTLLRTARPLEYPLRDPALSGQMFLAPRVVRVHGCFAAAIQPHTGTVPRSGQANHLARALVYGLLRKVHSVGPLLMGCQYMNAVMLRLKAPTREGRIMQTAAVKVAQGAQHLNLPVSDETVLVASSDKRLWCYKDTAAMRARGATCEVSPRPWNRCHAWAQAARHVYPKGANKLVSPRIGTQANAPVDEQTPPSHL